MHRGPKSRFTISLWKPDDWERVVLPYTVTTDHLTIKVVDVNDALFGGFKEIRFFGCGPSGFLPLPPGPGPFPDTTSEKPAAVMI